MNEAYALADRYRAGHGGCLGGAFMPRLASEAAGHADSVGEGEPVWLELLADVRAGRPKRIYRADVPFNLADSPMPAFHLLDLVMGILFVWAYVAIGKAAA